MKTTDYLDEARNNAQDTVSEFETQILDQLVKGPASDDLLNDYDGGDAWHHETHVDQDYSLLQAANVLSQLAEYEATDAGLWDGRSPRDAIAAMAAYTYGNAVYDQWRRLITEINEDAEEVRAYHDAEIADAEMMNLSDEHIEDLQNEKRDALLEVIRRYT